MSQTNPDGSPVVPKHPDVRGDELEEEKKARGLAAQFKIAEQVLIDPSPSFDFPTLPQKYKILQVFASLRGDLANLFTTAGLILNNDSTDANYFRQEWRSQGSTTNQSEWPGNAGSRTMGIVPAGTSPAGHFALIEFTILDYARSDKIKAIRSTAASTWGITTGTFQARQQTIFRNNQAAIDRIALAVGSGNFAPGSSVSIYGVESSFG